PQHVRRSEEVRIDAAVKNDEAAGVDASLRRKLAGCLGRDRREPGGNPCQLPVDERSTPGQPSHPIPAMVAEDQPAAPTRQEPGDRGFRPRPAIPDVYDFGPPRTDIPSSTDRQPLRDTPLGAGPDRDGLW